MSRDFPKRVTLDASHARPLWQFSVGVFLQTPFVAAVTISVPNQEEPLCLQIH